MADMTILGAILLALDVYAIWCILHEPWEGMKKVLWIAAIMFFQLFAMVAYFAFFRTKHDSDVLPPR